MNERRIARLQEQLKQRLAELLQRDVADPKLGFVTISRVELDAEFTVCKAYWSVLAPTSVGEAKAKTQSAEVLTRARGMLQREMGKGLATRTIPRLEFVFDEGVGGAVRVNRLLADLAKDRPPQPQPPVDEPPAN
ncbi:MAG: 30S ribosome-binding factor RbfA [Planctomycetota bacterium]|jgi:ribosome-binding factor A